MTQTNLTRCWKILFYECAVIPFAYLLYRIGMEKTAERIHDYAVPRRLYEIEPPTRSGSAPARNNSSS